MTLEDAQLQRIRARKALTELIDVLGLDDRQRKRLLEAIEASQRADYAYVRLAKDDPLLMRWLPILRPVHVLKTLPHDFA